MERATLTMSVGRLKFNILRDFIKRMEFLGRDIRLSESSGFFERVFTLEGTKDEVLHASETLKQLEKY